jgi:hypothetical protein
MRLLLTALLLLSTFCFASPTPTILRADASRTNASISSHSQPAMYPLAATEARQDIVQPAQAQLPRVAQSESPVGRTQYELGLSFALLAFSAVALVIVAVLAARAAKPWSPDSIIRVFGIVMIVPLAVFLVVAGYSEKQVAPVVGLLGVIAGYLLGHTQRPSGGS